ncbi:MAG: sugar phosphate nucleotidyltransferase, partial [Bacillota bacterium]
IRFLEKPSWSEVFSDTVNTGIYIIQPDIFKYYEANRFFDFSKDLFPLLMGKNESLYGYVAEGYWSDIGSLEQYRQTHYDILDGKVQASVKGKQAPDGVWLGENVTLDPTVKITPPVFIGDNCRVSAGVQLGEYAVLGRENVLRGGATVRRSIMWDYNYLDHGVELRGAVLCSHTQVQANSALYEGVVIGDSSFLGQRVSVKPQVKVWPDKVVEDNTVLTDSLIWGEMRRKNLFSVQGVGGLANIEITPEFTVKLAVAYGANLRQGSQVVLSTDYHRASQVAKKAFTAGLLAAGISVSDIGVTTTSITRYAVKSLHAAGGVHIRLIPPFEKNRILLEFLDDEGINVSKDFERKIENAFFQEDFRRPDIGQLGEVRYVPQLADAYREGILKTINHDLIRRCRFKVLVAYDYLNLGWFIPPVFEKLGCQVSTVNQADYSLKDLAAMVRENRMDMGIVLNSNADQVMVITEEGQIIRDEEIMTLWAAVVFGGGAGRTLGIPVTAPSVIEKLAEASDGTLVRTKANPRALMEVSRGGLFQPLFDGTYIFIKLLEYLQGQQKSLSNIINDIPKTHVHKEVVQCPWTEKGLVMRRLMEDIKGRQVELLDGIKIYHPQGWALVLPDSEEPVFLVFSEAGSDEQAKELAAAYAKKIEEFKSAS